MFFLPKLETLTQTVKTTDAFTGLDQRENIADSALADCVNISPSGFPALLVCNPWMEEDTPPVSDLFNISAGGLIMVQNTNPVRIIWKRQNPDGTAAATTVTLSAGDSLAAAENYMDDLVLLLRTTAGWRLCRYGKNGSKIKEVDMSPFLGSTDLYIGGMLSFGMRLMILCGGDARLSYYNDLEKWDQYLVDGKLSHLVAQLFRPNNGGHFTGCADYKSQPVLFQREAIYLIQNNAAPYFCIKAADVGCINPRSIAVVGGVLYFLSREGVMAYNGSLPRLVSACCPALSQELKESGGCALNGCYYLGNYVYDPQKDAWSKLREPLPEQKISAAGVFDGSVYYQMNEAGGNSLYRYDPAAFDPSLTPEKWSVTTKRFHENESSKKKLTKLAFRIEPHQAVSFCVEISADGGDWQTVLESTAAHHETKEIVLKLPPCQDMRLRISGTGKVNIPYLRRIYRVIPDGKIHPFI